METLDPEGKKTKIKNINQGTYFKLKPTTTAPVWVRGEYERSLGKYSCFKFDDTNHEKFMKGSQDVYINFTFLTHVQLIQKEKENQSNQKPQTYYSTKVRGYGRYL